MKTKLHQIVIGDENVNVASQIRILIEGIDSRYKKLFIKINTDATSEKVISEITLQRQAMENFKNGKKHWLMHMDSLIRVDSFLLGKM